MKLITRDTDYSFRALSAIARSPEKIVPVSGLVRQLKAPRAFLRKILQILERRGYVASYKGKGGGFAILKSPRKVFLLDVMRIFQGPFKLNECTLRKHLCPNTQSCNLKKKIDAIEANILKQLGSVTLACLVENKEGKWARRGK